MNEAAPVYLGPYRLLNVVHDGQSTQVWKAYHDANRGFFAIKTLNDRFRKSRTHIRYLKRELMVGRSLSHPRIIAVLDFSVDKGVPYLVVEWFPATNMKNRIRQGLESTVQIVPKVVLQAAEAVTYLHSRGWIHRDIKPENFLVADDGDLRLINFALAQRKSGFFRRLLRGKPQIQGTRSYMSPEQIRGEPLDERSDLYSLACTFYELVSGKPPFTGKNSHDLLKKHLKAAPPSLELANRNVTPAFSQLIRRAMSKRPGLRATLTRAFYSELRETAVFRRASRSPG